MTTPQDDADRDLLLRYLDGRDRACPGCGYNLRDLRSPLCPECGQALTLSLRLVEPRQGPLIAGLIGLASGCGMGGLMLIFFLILSLIHGHGGSETNEFLTINGAGFLVHALAISLWLRFWNRIRTARPSHRAVLILFCYALPLTFVAVFTAYIR